MIELFPFFFWIGACDKACSRVKARLMPVDPARADRDDPIRGLPTTPTHYAPVKSSIERL